MNPEQLIILLLLAAGAGVAIYRNRHPPAIQAAPPTPRPGPWRPEDEKNQWLETAPDAADLYRRLGYDLDVEWQIDKASVELTHMVEVEIPDFDSFTATLEKVAAQLSENESRTAALEADEGAELWRDVMANRHDENAVLARLNRDPIGEILPFVEKIPVGRGARTTWRMPVEVRLLRKRPKDPKAFSRSLKKLESTVRSAKLRRRGEEESRVLEALERVSRDLSRDNAYLPTSMRDLTAKMDKWLTGSRQRGAKERRIKLDELLLAALQLRHSYSPRYHPAEGLAEPESADFQKRARTQADAYLHEKWMQVPGLTRLLLANILTSELCPLPVAERQRPSSSAAVLALVCDEILSGHYDAGETERRLHQLEDRGRYVHSLVYALLRLSSAETS